MLRNAQTRQESTARATRPQTRALGALSPDARLQRHSVRARSPKSQPSAGGSASVRTCGPSSLAAFSEALLSLLLDQEEEERDEEHVTQALACAPSIPEGDDVADGGDGRARGGGGAWGALEIAIGVVKKKRADTSRRRAIATWSQRATHRGEVCAGNLEFGQEELSRGPTKPLDLPARWWSGANLRKSGNRRPQVDRTVFGAITEDYLKQVISVNKPVASGSCYTSKSRDHVLGAEHAGKPDRPPAARRVCCVERMVHAAALMVECAECTPTPTPPPRPTVVGTVSAPRAFPASHTPRALVFTDRGEWGKRHERGEAEGCEGGREGLLRRRCAHVEGPEAPMCASLATACQEPNDVEVGDTEVGAVNTLAVGVRGVGGARFVVSSGSAVLRCGGWAAATAACCYAMAGGYRGTNVQNGDPRPHTSFPGKTWYIFFPVHPPTPISPPELFKRVAQQCLCHRVALCAVQALPPPAAASATPTLCVGTRVRWTSSSSRAAATSRACACGTNTCFERLGLARCNLKSPRHAGAFPPVCRGRNWNRAKNVFGYQNWASRDSPKGRKKTIQQPRHPRKGRRLVSLQAGELSTQAHKYLVQLSVSVCLPLPFVLHPSSTVDIPLLNMPPPPLFPPYISTSSSWEDDARRPGHKSMPTASIGVKHKKRKGGLSGFWNDVIG
ncbi:hypothetical protein B0H14DRAFT_3774136 [Mycena olivaceomarginata]|nr:hypothetical protein B0H14DRAFT_3774136 [Mycena olivaceomarginata]